MRTRILDNCNYKSGCYDSLKIDLYFRCWVVFF